MSIWPASVPRTNKTRKAAAMRQLFIFSRWFFCGSFHTGSVFCRHKFLIPQLCQTGGWGHFSLWSADSSRICAWYWFLHWSQNNGSAMNSPPVLLWISSLLFAYIFYYSITFILPLSMPNLYKKLSVPSQQIHHTCTRKNLLTSQQVLLYAPVYAGIFTFWHCAAGAAPPSAPSDRR